MDVNRDNFYDVLPQILEDINNADFVAIDGEFTGISAFDKLNYFDTPAERYQRHYEIDRKYRMVQLGLAMMRCTNPAENRFELKAYNFYIFPQDERDACDLISKTSSLQFLAANNFDFTQLFLKGIPIVCKSTHLKKVRESSRPPSESPNQRQMTNGNANDKKPSAATTNNNAVDYSQMTDDEVLRSTMTGFSEVIWKLQESGKPLVGHNLHMDLLHLIHEYFTPIPSSYEDYKTIVKNLFPKIIDTKTIASTTIFQNLITNTALNAVYRAVRESAFPLCHFQTPENFKYRLGEHEHTAGYDATCTAVCLAKMMAFIAEKTNFKENFMGHPLMNSFYGKIFYMRSFDLKYSDLLNNDELPDRSCVFYIKHPPSVSTYSLREFFHAWNLLTYDRLDPSTYIVALGMKNETTDTLLAKLRANAKDFTILSHAEYHRLSPTKIKVKEPNHLFDTDITNRKSNRRSNVDRDAPEAPKPVQMPMEIETSGATAPPPVKTIAKILEEKEKASGVKKRKLFDYDDEW